MSDHKQRTLYATMVTKGVCGKAGVSSNEQMENAEAASVGSG